MMMIHRDTGSMPPNALANATVDAVRRALQGHTAGDATPELRTALHTLSREAREKAVPPEQLLITLKNVWQSLPEVESARDFGEQTRMLQRLVTICIKEYFAD